MSLNRRYANRWTANFGYTYSRSEGLEINPGSAAIASTGGQDPNDYVNFTGRLSPNDRPHVFNATGTYEIPRIEVQVSGNLTLVQGIPYGAQFQVNLPQGRRSIYFESPGAYRTPSQQWLHFRVHKILFRNGPRYLEVGAEIRNALQELSIDTITTRIFTSPNFGAPSAWAIPRQLMFRVRGYF